MKDGFTLIELLAVVIIVAILTSIALPQYRRSVERSRVAEALEMLPAIYDAQQRYYVESEVTPLYVSFSLLDINLRGRPKGSSQIQWETGNFVYTVAPRLAMMKLFGRSTAPVYAQTTKGKYANSEIFYDGESFFCCDNGATGACEAFGIAVNSSYCSVAARLANVNVGSVSAWSAIAANPGVAPQFEPSL